MNGFIVRDISIHTVITHSFNLFNDEIIDFARVDNPKDSIKGQAETFPHEYYGLEIPHELLLAHKKAIFQNHSMNPLLAEYYCHENQ